jgi:hypothetical protein
MLSPLASGEKRAKNGASSADIARFLVKMRGGAGNECWLWTASVTGRPTHQYGQFVFGPTKVYAHRFVWELVNGPVPSGKVVCHSCDVTRCCNPQHMFLGSQGDNIRDAAEKGHLRIARKRNREVKPEVVQRYLAGGVTARELGTEYGISFMTVHRWIHEATHGVDQRCRNGNKKAS